MPMTLEDDVVGEILRLPPDEPSSLVRASVVRNPWRLLLSGLAFLRCYNRPRQATIPPALGDDVIGEILLRLPPDEPSSLLRASVVCKPWRRLLSDPSFRRQYREFHRRLPMLGFVYSWRDERRGTLSRFISNADSRPRVPDLQRGRLLDCRHGRALFAFYTPHLLEISLLVWDPRTGGRKALHKPGIKYERCWAGAAVLCAAARCSHDSCRGGPFLVVLIEIDREQQFASACVYTSETAKWSTTAPVNIGNTRCPMCVPSVLIGDALYFMISSSIVLKYELGRHCLTAIQSASPPLSAWGALLLAPGGVLGRVILDSSCLHLSYRGAEVDAWTHRGTIDLNRLLPTGDRPCPLRLIGSAEGTYIIFVARGRAAYMIDLKSLRWRKMKLRKGVSKKLNTLDYIFPCMGF